MIYLYIGIGGILVYWSHIGALKVGALTLIHADSLDSEQARKSSEDTQVAGYARFEKVWAG